SGGQTVDDYLSFAAALDDLWDHPAAWQTRGQKGQEYVRTNYGSLEEFQQRLEEALAAMTVPLREQMRTPGVKRAAPLRPSAWREQFSNLVEKVLHAPGLPHHEQVEIRPYKDEIKAGPGSDLLLGMRLTNRGTHPLLAEGPGRTFLSCQVQDAQSAAPLGPVEETPLPALLLPGQSAPAALALRAPESPGRYQIVFWLERASRNCRSQISDCRFENDGCDSALQSAICNPQSAISLIVEPHAEKTASFCAPLLESVQSILAQAQRQQRLPDDYIDVCEGFLARCKRWLKQKLLNNFKRAYVNVLSRQQSQVNQQLVSAVQELAECCATLDHAVRVLQERLAR